MTATVSETQKRRYVSPVLLASVVVIATSGLIYELVAGTIASYVLGDSVAQFSFVIGMYLFAMGLGSYLSKFVEHRLLERFVDIELAIALVGGASAPILFAVYTNHGAFRLALYSIVLLVGTLVGLEIPILIRLLKFRVELKDLVARVLSLDYVGALVASLLFPLIFLPRLGIHRTSLIFGLLNAVVALLATFLLPVSHQAMWRLRAQCVVIIVALGAGVGLVERSVLKAESHYYGAPVIHAVQSPYQRIVITQSTRTTRLFLNGNLQFSSDDERRYHEVLVHPGIGALGRVPKHVLILGGGDGLAARELLRYPAIEKILLVDLDPMVTEVFSSVPIAVKLNEGALSDPRVEVRNEDAFIFLDAAEQSYDLVIVDFPDPSNYALGKLYTLAFYRKLREVLGVRGAAVVQATSPYYARSAFWSINATLQAAEFSTIPMHVHVPSFGEWGFIIAGAEGIAAPTSLSIDTAALHFLEPELMRELFIFPRDMQKQGHAPVNRLNHQQLVGLYTEEWESWGR